MHLSRRPTNFRQQFTSSRLRAFILISTVITFFLTPLAAHAQGPNSFWIPPYRPQQVPPVADVASLESATVDATLRLIVDTDPGVDDAVALAWLLGVLEPEQLLGIVTVAGNTTVENATANVYTVLSLMDDPDVEVVMGAKKPLSQKLSATGKLIHGQDGLWGQQLIQAAHMSKQEDGKDARNFYCSNAKNNPDATILALGPLTNLAEAIRHCRTDMLEYDRIVILGGAKFGGNTTPVAEFNFWQDPEAAQIVLGAGIPIALVPLETFTQLGFSPIDIFGFPPIFPPAPPENGIFADSTLDVFQYLAFPVAIYSATQLQAGVAEPSIPDLTAAIYTVFGSDVVLQAASPAVVEVVDKPNLVRGQSIIGLSFPEWLTMLSRDKELDNIANKAFSSGGLLPDLSLVGSEINEILARVPSHITVITLVDAPTMRSLFLADLTASVASLNAQPEVGGQAPLPDSLYLPSVTSE